jgi:hypothetical protein
MLKITKIEIRKVTTDCITKLGWSSSTYSEEMDKKARIYIFPEGEGIYENLMNRCQRPHTTYRKEVIPSVLAEMGLPANTKVRWSQYAGCSCPCSPGFVIDDVRGTEVFVSVEEK